MAAKLINPAISTVFIKVEIDLAGGNWNSTSPTFTDVTADLRLQDGIRWQRGQNAAWDQMAPGSFSFTLNNRTGTYDAATNSAVVGRRQCRITMYYPDTSHAFQQYLGLIDVFEPSWPRNGKDAIVSVSGVDLLSEAFLSHIVSLGVGGVLGGTTSAVKAMQGLAAAAGIPTAWQSFAAGSYTLKAYQWKDTDVLSAMTNVVLSQIQFMYVSSTGVLTTAALSPGSITNTYGDGGGSELPYSELKGRVGGAGAYTQVVLNQSPATQVQSQGGVDNPPVSAVVSSALVTKYGTISLSLNAAPVTTPAALAAAWAATVATPATYLFTEIEVQPLLNPSLLAAAVLGQELNDRITVKTRPVSGGTVTKNSAIVNMTYEIGGGDWKVTFGLRSSASAGTSH